MRRRVSTTTSLAAAFALAALASAAHAEPVRIGETQGLGIFGRDAPAILQKAKADPYAAPAEPACQSVPQEIEALNAALGEDADQGRHKTNPGAKLIGGAVRGLIPHRDVIRFLTGAGKKDDVLKQSVMAGWARRGYLKGLAKTLDCTSQSRVVASGSIPPLEIPPVEPATGQAAPVGASLGSQPALTPASAVQSGQDVTAHEAQPVNP